MILVSLENVKKCASGGCTITSKTKINVFRNFSHSAGLFGAAPFEKNSKNVILALEANIVLSCENETKIVKITQCYWGKITLKPQSSSREYPKNANLLSNPVTTNFYKENSTID